MIDDRATPPEATTTTGRVRGVWRQGSAAFLGIPFAEPPTGARRFAAPQPKEAWAGVLDATAHGPTPQRRALSEVTLIPEPSVPGDATLNVDVFTPAPGLPTGAGLPVLVWIHGGGFVAGSPASPWYDGRAFNRDGVVTVTVSYRLGFDGFGWIDGAPPNRGVLDWLLALRWVRDNVAAFGGDPTRVTIAGQSAGGAAVLTLLGMPAAQGLFAAAWSLSGLVPGIPADRAQRYAARLAVAAGVTPDREGFTSVGEAELLAHQLALDEAVGEAGDEAAVGSSVLPDAALAPARDLVTEGLSLGPVIDGDLLPVPTLDAYRAGTGAGVPLVIGATDDEFALLVHEARGPLDALSGREALAALGLAPPALDRYLAARGERSTSDLVGRYVTDRLFRTATLEVLAARGAAPSWLYRFAWRSPVFGESVHCLDVPFWFDCLGLDRVAALAGPRPPQGLADDLHRAAVEFVVRGVPGWPHWSEPARLTWVFDTPGSVEGDGYSDVRALME
ncbi:carboxylesterase/lipase family protein [Humibacillus xanthopallidus]|uniref:carboxylesterase/lipase family protein n=1 Tax=Humibacillus xanthopallidus TaxID=412689 RepID=UPI00385135D4